MTTAERTFYVTGGTLRHDTPSYVRRQADEELFEGLMRGEFCYVLTSRQMGKSSLMVQTAARLRAAGVVVAALDLTAIGQNVTTEQWYDGLLAHLGVQLDLEDELDDFFQERTRLGPLQRWMAALREVVLPALEAPGGLKVRRLEGLKVDDLVPPQPSNLQPSNLQPAAGRLVIFLDEIDCVRSLPFSTDEFFAAIRECYNRRTQEPLFERLTFCLLGVAAPSDLIQDTRITPFNIGRRIELTDFTAAETAPFQSGLVLGSPEMSGRSEEEARALLGRVLYWTGGHPYLTQRLCQAVAEDASVVGQAVSLPDPAGRQADRLPHSEIRKLQSGVDRHCEALFLASGAQERDDNLIFVRERLLNSEADRASLLDLYGKVRSGTRVRPDDTNPLIDRLRLSGVTRLADARRQTPDARYDGRGIASAFVGLASDVWRLASHARLTPDACLHVRNRIYARVFDRRWVTEHMPDAELRRQKAAYQRGLLRAAGLASVILAVVSGLAVFAFTQRNAAIGNAVRADRNFRLANAETDEANYDLYVANMNLIQSDWESGNVGRIQTLLAETRGYAGRGFEWGYWNRLCHLDLRTLTGHTGSVISASFSPDSRRIVTGSGDGTAKVWDAGSGREILTLKGHRAGVLSVCFSPDGRRIATGSADKTAKVWDAQSGQQTLTLKGHTVSVDAASFSPDGRRLVTGGGNTPIGGGDKTAKVWDAQSGREILTLKGHVWDVDAASFSPDGRRILTSSSDGTAKVWDAESGREILTLTGHKRKIQSAAFSPDGRRIATGSDDMTAKVWDAQSGREMRTLKAYTIVLSIGFSPDGRHLVTGGEDNMAKVWDVASGREILTLKGHGGQIRSAAFSPDGQRIVTGSDDRTAKVWDAQNWRETLNLTGPGVVLSVCYSSDGRRILAGGTDKTAKVWDATSGREMLTLKGHSATVRSVSFSGDGRRIVTGSLDNTARVWDATSGREMLTLRGHTLPVLSVSFSPDGRRIVTGSRDNTAKVWDAKSGREIVTLKGHSSFVHSVSFSPDSRRIVTGSEDNTAKVWDAASGRELLTLKGHSVPVHSVSFSLDGRQIVTGSVDGTAKVWDVASGRELLTLKGHASLAMSAGFSPDGRRIVTGGSAHTAKVWDAASGRELLTLKGHTDTVFSASFSPDGRRIVTGSGDGTVRVWFSEATDRPGRLPNTEARQ